MEKNSFVNTKFWNWYFKVYDRNQSRPYLKLLRENAQAVVGQNPAGRFLDIGCGTGNSTGAMLVQLGAKGSVLGIDNSQAALLIAQSKFNDPRIEFGYGDIGELIDYPEASFDGVLANNSLYLVAQPETVIRQVFNILKPGGRFLLTNPLAGASVSQIFREHMAETRDKLEKMHGSVFGGLMLKGHYLKAIYNYSLLFPFQIALKNGVKMVSNYWPAEKWQEIIDSARQNSGIPIEVKGPYAAYAGTNSTFICSRLPA
jgi:ubiquinone/menaquinone biosynthesis C-methylase UbiE